MVALSMRPGEVKTLQLTPEGVTGFGKAALLKGQLTPRPYAGLLPQEQAAGLLAWVQAAIKDRRLPDPGLRGSKAYRTITGRNGLMPKDLRVLGSHYASQDARTEAHRMHIRRV